MSKKKSEREEALRLPEGIPDTEETPLSGLTDEEAAAAAGNGLSNKPSEEAGKTVLRIIASNTFTWFNLLNILLAAALAVVGAYRNMLFLGVVVSNTLIGIIQELRAKKTVERLKLLSEAPVAIMRGGEERRIPAEQTVRGDIAVLRAGDQIPADAVVVDGGCTVCEALLTGEADGVPKKRGDWLYSGSYLTAGKCRCRLVYVGDESYINRLTRSAKRINTPSSALMTDLRRIVRTVSAFLIPIGILLFLKQYYLQKLPLDKAVPSAVASMIGMIPEGLILLVSVALTVGVIKLARKRTLIQQLYGIETLARVNVLCLDKTGTLTTGSMKLRELLPVGCDEETFRALLSRYLGATDDLSSPTVAAIAGQITPEKTSAVARIPFSSDNKYAAVTLEDGTTLALGALSFLPGHHDRGPAGKLAAEYARKGTRVLALAKADGAIENGRMPDGLSIAGLCLIKDELRESSAECMRYFREQGVDVKIISGDDPGTVSAIAAEAGVFGAENAVDASSLSDDGMEDAVSRFTVFGRVTPQIKKKLVEALKKKGFSVAMTGDGVNDIPALKAADCSIAMAAGADATRRSSQIVLLDSDFSVMPQVVYEGRRVINNISRTASLFLVKTTYSFLLSLLVLFLPASYPFQPIQLTLVSTLTIGLPSFLLAFEPDNKRVGPGFLRRVIMNALPGGIAVTVCAAAASPLGRIWQSDVCSTIATVSAGIVGLAMLFSVCLPFTRLRCAVFCGMCVLFAVASLFFGRIFYLVPLSAPQIGALAAISAVGVALIALLRFALSGGKRRDN